MSINRRTHAAAAVDEAKLRRANEIRGNQMERAELEDDDIAASTSRTLLLLFFFSLHCSASGFAPVICELCQRCLANV